MKEIEASVYTLFQRCRARSIVVDRRHGSKWAERVEEPSLYTQTGIDRPEMNGKHIIRWQDGTLRDKTRQDIFTNGPEERVFQRDKIKVGCAVF